MSVQKTIVQLGNGIDLPRAGDTITIAYTGYIYDSTKIETGYRGAQFDTSAGRGDFTTVAGLGYVIRGWDLGIVEVDGGMTLGEQAVLTITPEYAYGHRGFPGLIPPNATLIFDIELLAIGDKRA